MSNPADFENTVTTIPLMDERTMLAGMMLQGMIASEVQGDGLMVPLSRWGERTMLEANAEEAVGWADALIVALEKTEGETCP